MCTGCVAWAFRQVITGTQTLIRSAFVLNLTYLIKFPFRKKKVLNLIHQLIIALANHLSMALPAAASYTPYIVFLPKYTIAFL
jgi:hypothetical protein